jgi:hypothetical protein
MSGQEATTPRSKIASTLKSLETTLPKPTGSGGEPHTTDHYCQSGGGQKSQGGK